MSSDPVQQTKAWSIYTTAPTRYLLSHKNHEYTAVRILLLIITRLSLNTQIKKIRNIIFTCIWPVPHCTSLKSLSPDGPSLCCRAMSDILKGTNTIETQHKNKEQSPAASSRFGVQYSHRNSDKLKLLFGACLLAVVLP